MSEKVLCVKIESEGNPYVIGEIGELESLLHMVIGEGDDIEEGETVTLTFPRLTREELDAIPEWDG